MRILLTLMTVLFLIGCTGGESSSSACQTTTQTDANGNPITTVGCK
jgi:hypothetical protein